MSKQNLSYLLVNTTNEFLVEYNTLDKNSLYKLTNFSGSTAQALVTPDIIYLFVDGRYHIQADLEVDKSKVSVVKLNSWKDFKPELLKILPEGSTLGLFSKKNSIQKVQDFSQIYKIILLDEDPFDENVVLNPDEFLELNEKLTGMSVAEKCKKIVEYVDLSENEAILLCDLDDISYVFNIRDFDIPYSAKVKARALIFKNQAQIFTADKFNDLEEFLHHSEYKILMDYTSTNEYYLHICSNAYKFENPIPQMRAHKTNAEIEHMKIAFEKTDNALRAVRDYIYSNDNISEYDIEQKLREEFKNNGALGLSFKPIIAKDKNSALAHYTKSSKDEIIKEGSLVLIDCGAYFDGGLATDITRVFVKGQPSEIHKKIYTLVLKAFLNAFNSCAKNGFDIDKKVREFFNSEDCEGFVFNHGLGHGLGINVHEYPPSLSNGDLAKVCIDEGMCFTIEPGLYKEGCFGVRLENSCFMKDDKICSFVKMNYENKLINYEMLNSQEKEWLKEFEVK